MRKTRREKRRVSIGALAGRALCACALVATMAPAAALAVEGADGASLAAGVVTAQEEVNKTNYSPAINAVFTGKNEVTFSGYTGAKGRRPVAAMVNPKVTVSFNGKAIASDVALDGETTTVVTIADDVAVGTYTAVITSDNYNDKTVSFSYPAATAVTIGGANYEYLDEAKALAYVDAEAKATALAAYTRIGETDIYYKVAEGSTELSGTVYGMDMTNATSYSALYNRLVEGANFAAEDYDAITSATGIVANPHYGQLSPLVVRDFKYDSSTALAGTTEEQKLENKLTGAYCTPTTVDAVPYVEAYILNAAKQVLSAEQKTLLNVRLNGNATVDPSKVTDRVAVDTVTTSGFFTGWSYFDPTALAGSKAYGQVKFVIRPTAGENTTGGTAFSWADYYASMYAGTISNGEVTIGMAPWIDLYAEGGHSAVEMSINNGTNPYNTSNKATVNRFASMYDPATGSLKAGEYTITVYAAGYNPLTYTFKLGAAVPSEDLKSLEIQKGDFAAGVTATVTAYKLNEEVDNPIGVAGAVYAQDVAVADGKITLDKMLDAGDYKVAFSDKTVYTFKVGKEAATTAAEAAANAASAVFAGVDFADEAAAEAAIASYDALSGEAQAKIATEITAKIEAARKAIADKHVIASAKVSAKPTYNGKAQTPAVDVTAVDGSAMPAEGYDVAYTNNVNAGTATVTVTAKAPYKGSAQTTFVIAKATNTVKLAKASKKLKAKKVKKKAQAVAIKKAIDAQGAVTYSIAKVNKAKGKFKINAKTGKITVKKKAKKGTYKVTVVAKAAGNTNYNAGTATAVVTITVK